MRGRKKKPTPLKILHGSREPTSEPLSAPQADLRPPAPLSRAAKAIWRAQASIVAAMNLLTAADVEAFAHFCELVITIRRLTKRIADEGEILETIVLDSKGEQVKKSKANPAVPILRAAEKE